MANRIWVVAVSVILAISPSLAANPAPPSAKPSPTDSAEAKYCLRVEPATGSLIETVRCWTRAHWAEQGVDVDREWAEQGVAVIK